MSDSMTIPVYYLLGVIMLMLLMGIIVAAVMPRTERVSRIYFISYYAVLILCTGVYAVDLYVYMKPDLAWFEKAAVHLEYLIMSLPMPMLTAYLLHCCGEDWKKSKIFRIVLVLWCLYLILLEAAQFTTCFYYITADNRFFRGPLHMILLFPLIMVRFINLATLIHRRSRLSKKYFYAFLLYLIPMTIGAIIHSFVFIMAHLAVSICFCSFTMYILILTDQIEQYMKQQREISFQQKQIAFQQQEIARQHASVMVLQMRPHFIFNTMMSIYSLCNQDSRKARQVILDFTTYLRKNFNGIASGHTVPFSEELEHTRAYLAVEQAQFEDSLFVDFDTQCTHFRLPPLTLQPIVENAVKHGLDPCSSPLHITIRTWSSDSGTVITVEDDGPGFDPDDDSKTHITLKNIEQRLEMMCGGHMEISSGEGQGTVVKLTIPMNMPEDE